VVDMGVAADLPEHAILLNPKSVIISSLKSSTPPRREMSSEDSSLCEHCHMFRDLISASTLLQIRWLTM
ncbi:MAG: hypothetical protein NUK65_12640, partial [Firmicutes bacterium]|nr:hypothetical protein [Bacillota bacterium]